jgi:hypothetical protein
MTHTLMFLISRRTGSGRLLVQAFSAGSTTISTSTRRALIDRTTRASCSSTTAQNLVRGNHHDRGGETRTRLIVPGQPWSLPLSSLLTSRPVVLHRTLTTSRSSAAVEEDLDAALEDILGEALKEAEEPHMNQNGHMRDSKPMPRRLIERDEDVIDYKDPKFLSTSNPYWVQSGLSPTVIDVLSNKGITQFTPVQAEAFAPVLAGRDVIGRSRTGTGKTLAFGIPALTRLIDFTIQNGKRDPTTGRMRRGRLPSMLILCPTRELARQVNDELAQVAQPLGLFTEVFHGGVSYDNQARALRQGVDCLVGTPGRIMDHMDRGNLNLSECDVVVLDEADEMLNMGFAEDVEVS